MGARECGFSFRPLPFRAWPVLLLAAWAGGAQADKVYKCTNEQGEATFRDTPCAVTQNETVVEVAPAPAHAPAPDTAAKRTPEPRRASREVSSSGARADGEAWECRAADGQVFYRLTPCPRTIAALAGKSSGTAKSATVGVSATRVSREYACGQMHRAGAVGRDGHRHDEDVSTYDRNLGRDPCR